MKKPLVCLSFLLAFATMSVGCGNKAIDPVIDDISAGIDSTKEICFDEYGRECVETSLEKSKVLYAGQEQEK